MPVRATAGAALARAQCPGTELAGLLAFVRLGESSGHGSAPAASATEYGRHRREPGLMESAAGLETQRYRRPARRHKAAPGRHESTRAHSLRLSWGLRYSNDSS